MLTRSVAAAFILTLLAAPCFAQSNKALNLVPDDALGFFVIKDLRRLSDKVSATGERLGVPERVSMLELLQKEMGIKEGINENGSVLFIVLKGEDGSPRDLRYVMALPVADHAKIAKQLAVKEHGEGISQGELGHPSGLIAGVGGSGPEGEPKKFPVLVAKRGDFVLLGPPEQRPAIEAVLQSKKDITASLKGTEDWLGQQDMAGFVTHAGVEFGLGLFLFGSGQTSPQQAGQLKDTYAEVKDNVRLITFGGRLEKDDWRLSTAVHFQADGSYAKWIAQAEPLENKLLGNFADEPYLSLLLARISSQTTFESATRHLFGSLPKEKAEALQGELTKLIGQCKELTIGVYPGKSSKQPEPGIVANRSLEPVMLAQVRDAEAFLGGAVDMIKHAHRSMHEAAKIKAEVTYQEKEIAGKPSWLITIVPSKDPAGDDKEEATEPARLPLDPNDRSPRTFLLTALDKQTVLASKFADADQAAAVIEKFSKPATRSIEGNSHLQHTMKLLPEKRQVAAFVDLKALGIMGAGVAQAPNAPPLGFLMRALPAGIEAQFVVPLDTAKAAFDASKAPRPQP